MARSKDNTAPETTPAAPTTDDALIDRPEINALFIDNSRFCAEEISAFHIRVPINRAHAAFKGIHTIGKILYANEIEKQANSGKMSLPDDDQEGLFQALIVLADVGMHDMDELGIHHAEAEKGGV